MSTYCPYCNADLLTLDERAHLAMHLPDDPRLRSLPQYRDAYRAIDAAIAAVAAARSAGA